MTGLKAALLAAATIAATATAAFGDEEATLETGRAYTQAFQEGEFDRLWGLMSDEMRAALSSPQALTAVREAVTEDLGAEKKVLSETTDERGGFRTYLRTALHEKSDTPLLTQWALDDDDRIYGFFVRPVQEAAETRYLDYQTKAELYLPFEGEWTVVWGGRTPQENYHAINAGQRFASDFLIARDGATHDGDGAAPEDHHCWDEPILAPADGTVAAAVDGLPDQPIGEMDPANPTGNHVVLDLGNDEYAFLAHFREGSVAVKEGEAVKRGDVLGRCGNSGNTTEPHLHFHLQTSPVLGEGNGLPAFFNGYIADGEQVERGEPVRGQTISAGKVE